MHNRTFFIVAGLAVWLPLLLSFAAKLSNGSAATGAVSQGLLVLLLVAATLLLGLLIGRAAVVPAD